MLSSIRRLWWLYFRGWRNLSGGQSMTGRMGGREGGERKDDVRYPGWNI